MTSPWFPIVSESLGKLPENPNTSETYDLSKVKELPAATKEVLVYTFMTSIGEGSFQRGYFEIITSDDAKDYTKYMNVAYGNGVNIVNSINTWLPMPKDKLLRVNLVLPKAERGMKRSIAGTLAGNKDWSDVYIIGYKL